MVDTELGAASRARDPNEGSSDPIVARLDEKFNVLKGMTQILVQVAHRVATILNELFQYQEGRGVVQEENDQGNKTC